MGLRRELRFSKSKMTRNLALVGVEFSAIKPLLAALETTNGLLSLYGSELLLLEKALGISSGELAVDLVGELIAVKQVPAGTGISYGYLHRTNEKTNIGLVALGFSDGIPRSASNKFSVQIGERTCKGLGRIAMDQCVVEVSDSNPPLGSEVSFFNQSFDLNNWAVASGFTELEIIGRITSRVRRMWVA